MLQFDYVGNLSWVEGEFYQRLALYEEICQSGIKGEVGEVYYHKPSHLSVCHVPKVSVNTVRSNNTNARLMAFGPSVVLDPTFGIHSHKTLDTAQPCHLLKPK